ncbi:MAG: hypothetical protein ACREO1_06580 [Arenimonas sp.]
MSRFDGVSTTIKVDKIEKEGKGKHKMWASGFRLILDEVKQADSKPSSRYVIAFNANRNTKILNVQMIGDGETRDLGVELDANLPVAISVLPIDEEFIRVKINERSFKIRCSLKVRNISVSASGMFISTADFKLLPPAK